jgi:hypothetical protein
MKKITALLLIGTLTLAIAGCGSNSSDSTVDTPAVDDAADTQQTVADVDTAEDTQTADAEVSTGDVMSYEEFVAADLDTEVVVETYVQAKQDWKEDAATVYTQDEDGAYFLYKMACSEDDYDLLTQGTKIKVTGYKSEWSGEVEIVDATFEIVEGGDTYIASAFDVTKLLGTDGLSSHMNQLVSFTGMTVEAAGQDDDGNDVAFLYDWDGSGSEGSDLYFNVSYEGVTYSFTVESDLCGAGTDVYETVKSLNVGDTVDMEGFLYWYNGANPHITSVTVL